MDGHDNVRACTSVVDYVFRVLGIEYLGRTDLAHIVDESLVGQPKSHANGHPVGREHRARPGGTAAPAAAAAAPAAPANRTRLEALGADSGPDSQLGHFSGDAPLCDNCGHITIRNGTCYKCLNCGTSLGCS